MYTLADGSKSTDYELGDQFKVVSEARLFTTGTVIVLDHDDGTSCPRFREIGTGDVGYKDWCCIAAISPKISSNPDLHQAIDTIQSEIDSDQITVVINNDHIEIEVFGHVFMADDELSLQELIRCAKVLIQQQTDVV